MESGKVINNAFWIIACRIVQSVLGLVISMLTARYLGPSSFGIINYAASIVACITPLMGLGITSVIVRKLINSPEKEGRNTILSLL